MRAALVVSSLLLSSSLVAGCGSGGADSSSSAYCKDLKTAKSSMAFLSTDTPDYSKLGDAFKALHALAGEAPARVAAPWKTIERLIGNLEKAFADAGMTMEQFGALTQGTLPPGMTAQQVQALAPKLEAALAAADNAQLKKAGDDISKDAKAVCKLDLNS